MAGTKFCGSSSRLLLLSFLAFIMQSAAEVTEKTSSCYWCGPLAEQVHRSRRAPPCDAAGNHVTTCDLDLPHCAIIATSPPYVESRLCVKIYQDECYPLFCNSTKTWKMTCPCRGNLCNGPNMEREQEAFAILNKLVSKTQTSRIKRAQVKSAKIYTTQENTVIITNITAVENNYINITHDSDTSDDITQIMLGDQPTLEKTDENKSSTEITSKDEDQKETTSKMEIPPLRAPIPSHPFPSDDITKGLEVLKTDKLSQPVKPSEELPTAEALQQNAGLEVTSEKIATVTTNSGTDMDTAIDFSTEAPTPRSQSKNHVSTVHKTLNIILFTPLCSHFILSHV